MIELLEKNCKGETLYWRVRQLTRDVFLTKSIVSSFDAPKHIKEIEPETLSFFNAFLDYERQFKKEYPTYQS